MLTTPSLLPHSTWIIRRNNRRKRRQFFYHPSRREICLSKSTLSLSTLWLSCIRTWDKLHAHHVAILNVEVHLDVPLEHMVPVTFIPPLEWDQHPGIVRDPNIVPVPLCNGASAPTHISYYKRKKELMFRNHDAQNAIENGICRDEIKRLVKQEHFGQFEILYRTGRFWDISLDNYSVREPVLHQAREHEAMEVNEEKHGKSLFSQHGSTRVVSTKQPHSSMHLKRIDEKL